MAHLASHKNMHKISPLQYVERNFIKLTNGAERDKMKEINAKRKHPSVIKTTSGKTLKMNADKMSKCTIPTYYSVIKTTSGKTLKMNTNEISDCTIPTYNCCICSKKFGEIVDLRAHMESHENVSKISPLQYVERNFIKITNGAERDNSKEMKALHQHPPKIGATPDKTLKITNNNISNCTIETYVCSICSLKFGKKLDLMTHLTSHNNDASMVCKLCYRSFTSRESFIKHDIIHKIKCCQLCKAEFRTKGELKKHLTLHHPMIKGHYYLCKICDRKFNAHHSLKMHLKTHLKSQLICFICKKVLSTPQSHRNHCFLHINIKYYGCVVCSKSFRFANLLNSHIYDHHPNAERYCTACDTRLPKNIIRSHVLSHKTKFVQETECLRKAPSHLVDYPELKIKDELSVETTPCDDQTVNKEFGHFIDVTNIKIESDFSTSGSDNIESKISDPLS